MYWKNSKCFKKIDEYTDYPIWKEYEIRLYLFRHLEVEHLRMLKEYLVKTKNYSCNKDEEGILDTHKVEVGKILKKENEIRKLVLKYKKKTINR